MTAGNLGVHVSYRDLFLEQRLVRKPEKEVRGLLKWKCGQPRRPLGRMMRLAPAGWLTSADSHRPEEGIPARIIHVPAGRDFRFRRG